MTRKNALIRELRDRVAECEGEQIEQATQRMKHANAELGWSFTPAIRNPEARVPVLAVVLMLENRLDALPVATYADVKQDNDEQQRIDRLRSLLGGVSDEETAAAVALWEEVAE